MIQNVSGKNWDLTKLKSDYLMWGKFQITIINIGHGIAPGKIFSFRTRNTRFTPLSTRV